MFLKIIDDLRAFFESTGIPAIVDDGIESKNEQTNYDPTGFGRVVFVAKDPGAFQAPQQMGENDEGRRALFDIPFLFEVSFAGYDAENPTRDLAHRRRCIDLLEATAASVQLSYAGSAAWGAARWEDGRKNLRHGAELTVQLALTVPIFDSPAALIEASKRLAHPTEKVPA